MLPRIHLSGVGVYGFGAANSGGTDSSGYPNRKGGEGISIGAWNGLSGYSDIQITNTLIHDNEGTGLIMYGPEVAVNKNVYVGNIEVYRNTGRTTSPSSSQYSGAGAVIYNVSSGVVEHSSFHDNGSKPGMERRA